MYPEHGLPLAAVMLAPRLGALRRRQGKTQSDISRRLGIDPSIPSLWEQGDGPSRQRGSRRSPTCSTCR